MSCWRGEAQVQAPEAGSAVTADAPGRVARISYIDGPVSLRAAGVEAWAAAELNRPLTSGDELWTDEGARSELDLGYAFVRLDAHTDAEILNLDDVGVQISVLQGSVQVRLRELAESDEFEVDTPQAAATLLRPGEYRFDVATEGSQTIATVRSGQIEVMTPAEAFSVRARQQAALTGTDTVSYQINATPPLDAFDAFCATRDDRAAEEAQQYVSSSVIGRDDLDRNGTWSVSVAYGPIWRPRVAAGWAPYHFGHWVWIEPWGWTWVDDAPWGFAPFHYGRWVFVDGYWAWVPGPPRIRAVYAPALVVFVGGGPGLHYYFRIGAGLGVAWFPLGPREVYIPPYRASRTYITNVNISQTVIADRANVWRTDMTRQRYVNRTVAGAVAAVPEDVFRGGRPVERSVTRISAQQARDAVIGGSAPPVTPTRGSIAPAPADGRRVVRPPDAVSRREAVVRRSPAPAPVPFERRQPILESDPGRPADPARVEEVRRSEPQASVRTRPAAQPPTQPAARPEVRSRPQTAQAPAERVPPRDAREASNRRQTIERERQDGRGVVSRPQASKGQTGQTGQAGKSGKGRRR